MANRSERSELIQLVGAVKSRMIDKFKVANFPIPQFILIGKQSVGKSRLIEALAGEQFNFVSGTLGSRRPTVLEFSLDPMLQQSEWSVMDLDTHKFKVYPLADVMRKLGHAHESLGSSVTDIPINVRVRSPNCIDMQIVDLPGFRDFAIDTGKQALADEIDALVSAFMEDTRNVMICVEQAGDAANLSTLGRCKRVDPNFSRTILVRNKLDKYYRDLTSDNINHWMDGFGDLPARLDKFALSLPHWKEGTEPPKPFANIRFDADKSDIEELKKKNISSKFLRFVGYENFGAAMGVRIEKMFVQALGPVKEHLLSIRNSAVEQRNVWCQQAAASTDSAMLNQAREAGASFAKATQHLMEGYLGSDMGFRQTLAEEIESFHEWAAARGIDDTFDPVPCPDFIDVPTYLEYLEFDALIDGFDLPINGGAQYQRLLHETELYFRFADISSETSKRDVIQARGVSVGSVTWMDVVIKLLRQRGPQVAVRQVNYVAARAQWFFSKSKEGILDFMRSYSTSSDKHLYSALFKRVADQIDQNDTLKDMLFRRFDEVLELQAKKFRDLLTSTVLAMFQSPSAMLKASSQPDLAEQSIDDATVPTLDETVARIPMAMRDRQRVEKTLRTMCNTIPQEYDELDEAVDHVARIMFLVFSICRGQLADQLELLTNSLFLIPMLRIVEENMSEIQLDDSIRADFQLRAEVAQTEMAKQTDLIETADWCLAELARFSGSR